MMNLRKGIIGVFTFLAILSVGYYFQFQSNSSQNEKLSTKPENSVMQRKGSESSNYNENTWELDAKKIAEKNYSDPSGQTDGSINIKGNVIFAPNSKPRPLRIEVSYIDVPHPLPEKIERLIRQGKHREAMSNFFSRNPTLKDPKTQLSQKSLKKRSTQIVRTKADGSFRLDGYPTGIYSAKIKEESWTGSTGKLYFQTELGVSPIKLPARKEASFQGKVVNLSGNPITNARILRPNQGNEIRVDNHGRFEIENITPGEPITNYKIQAEGYITKTLNLNSFKSGESRSKTIKLKKSASLSVNVRSSEKKAVLKGRLLLRGLPSTESKRDSRSPIDNNSREIRALNPEGATLFESLSPGRYELLLVSSPFIAKPRKIKLDPGSNKLITIEAIEGKPLRIKFVDQNGEPIKISTRRISIRALDENNEILKPSFRRSPGSPPGSLTGRVHPDAEKIKVLARKRGGSTQTQLSHMVEVPDDAKITLRIPKHASSFLAGGSRVRFQLIVPDRQQNNGRKNESVTSVYVINSKTGSLVERLPIQSSSSKTETIQLSKGKYWIYSALRTNEQRYVYLQRVIAGDNLPEIIKLRHRPSASITGKVVWKGDGDRPPLGIGISLGNHESSHYPDPLQEQVNGAGKFSIGNIPPGMTIYLNVFSIDSRKIFAKRELKAVLPHSSRNISTIKIPR